MNDKSWTKCEITQDCSYGWTEDNVERFLDGFTAVRDYAYIVHDKDKKDDNTTPREPHIHLMVRFSYPVHTSAITARAKAAGLPDSCITPNRIEKTKRWSAALNYLTHRDEHKPWKHVYDCSEVHSNFDWQLESESAHQSKLLKKDNAREKEIVEAIESGEIRLYNMSEKITPYEEHQYAAAIKTAFARRTRELKLLKDRTMEVIFICGPSGVGKDTFARSWCEDKGLSYFTTGNNDKNPFDDYMEQDVIIWSDARDDVYKPAQLHTMLDNHFASTQKARYVDRVLNCRYFIITSIKPLSDWYSHFYAKENEDKKQLYRRIKTLYELTENDIKCSIYDERNNEYMYTNSYVNIYGHKDEHLCYVADRVDFAKEMRSDSMLSLHEVHDIFRKLSAVDPEQILNDYDNTDTEIGRLWAQLFTARRYLAEKSGKYFLYDKETDRLTMIDIPEENSEVITEPVSSKAAKPEPFVPKLSEQHIFW